MSIFVTGVTGTLGCLVVERLVTAGHSVQALSRSPENERALRDLGATPRCVDLRDGMSIQRAVDGCHTILHLATKIPPAGSATQRGAWDENNWIRAEGTRVLVDKALAAGVTTFLYLSVCLTYVGWGSEWIETDAAIDDARSPVMTSTVIAEQEVERFAAAGGRGIVLRMGYFYGPRAPNTREAIGMARFGIAALLGPAGAYLPQIWVDDAASAVVAACDAAPAGL